MKIIKNGTEHEDPRVNKQAASLFTKLISDHFYMSLLMLCDITDSTSF